MKRPWQIALKVSLDLTAVVRDKVQSPALMKLRCSSGLNVNKGISIKEGWDPLNRVVNPKM